MSVEVSLLQGNLVNRAKVRPTGRVNGNMQFVPTEYLPAE